MTARWPGAALIGFVLLLNAAFTALTILFGYDDVLREPAAEILRRFHAAGAPLVLAWAAFTAGALAFAWIGPMAERRVGAALPPWMAPAAALAMAAGLLRWVVAVPGLAAAHQDPAAAEATRQGAEMAFLALHLFAGAGIGEVLGPILLAAWTLGFARALRTRHPWLALAGFATLPLWLMGLIEPLAQALPFLPALEVAPLAFMAWEAWLLLLGGLWVAGR